MPRRTFSHETNLASTVEDIWLRLQDAETWVSFGPVDRVWEPTIDEQGHLRGFRWSAQVAGREYKGVAERIDASPPHSMVLRLDAGEIRGVLSTLTSPNGHDASFRVTLEIEPRGTLATLFFSVISEAVGRGLPRQVDRFAASMDGLDEG